MLNFCFDLKTNPHKIPIDKGIYDPHEHAIPLPTFISRSNPINFVTSSPHFCKSQELHLCTCTRSILKIGTLENSSSLVCTIMCNLVFCNVNINNYKFLKYQLVYLTKILNKFNINLTLYKIIFLSLFIVLLKNFKYTPQK